LRDFNTTRRSLRHFPRDAPGRGLRHTTIIIIAVSASVGGLLLTIFFWRILSRFLRRPDSAPFPPRQALVHQRELQLAAFTEHKNPSVPQLVPDDASSTPVSQGSDSALLPNARDWSAYTSNRASSYTHETDEGPGVGLTSSHLHPPSPHLFPPRIPHSASSSTSLPSSNDNSSPSSGAATPPNPFSTSTSPSHSFRRTPDRSAQRPRPSSMVSIGTHMTGRSRQSVRAAPHAPHSNVQIVLPAPLAPNLYEGTASEGSHMPRTFARDSAYSDSWRRSLVDTWISVGQHGLPEPEPMESRHSRDSMETRSRQTQSMCVALSVISILDLYFRRGFLAGATSPAK